MASSSKNGSSLHPNRTDLDEGWKVAPSRETTHDHPDGKDQRIERARKPLENAPGNTPASVDERVDSEDEND